MKKIPTIILWILFIFSILIVVRYSNYPVLKLPFNLEEYFIKPKETDGIWFNLAIGYIVSSIFYLLNVYFPEKRKRKKVEKVAMEDLASVCIDAIMMIVLMYKNVCSDDDWKFDHLQDDADFFDEKFFQTMELFDTYKDADTIRIIKEDNGTVKTLSWNDMLEAELRDYVERIDNVFTRYIYFLDDEIIDRASAFRNTPLIVAYLGLPSSKFRSITTGLNGVKYAERVPFYLTRQDHNRTKAPLFGKNDVSDNMNLLREFITALLSLRMLCIKKTELKSNIAIDNYCISKCGQCGIAIFEK